MMPESLPLKTLPFWNDSFDWDRFETFCLAVVQALPEVKRAARYGVQGEDQQGIDIEAELHDGRKRTIQCRHRKRATKTQVEKIVKGTTYPADEHEIWMTCPVGTNAADYIEGLDGWVMESAEGISQTVRGLPREVARTIVRDAFGAQVARDFLGPGGPVGFVSPYDYFKALDDPTRLIRQDLHLVGRAAELDRIVTAVVDTAVKVVVVPGRGGIGKTRLLRAAAEHLLGQGKRVLYALDPALLTAEVIDDLSLDDVVVVVEDAHRPDINLAPLMAATLRRSEPLTLMLGTRPAGVDQVLGQSARAQLEPQQLVVMPRLQALSLNDVEKLAEAALGESSERGRRLAEATDELPLLTVLGASMMASGDFDADIAAGAAQLRAAVLRRFVDEQRGRITPAVPDDKAQQLLVLLAALNPINTADEAVIGLVSDELGLAVSQLRRWLGEVEDAGLLLTRGELRRLTPDILADEVLYEACLDRQGRSTGRALELWHRYSSHAQTALLANLGELDWRLTADGEALLDEVWDTLLAGFRQTDAWGREQMIEKIAPAAYFWPSKILRLVDIAIAEPARTTNWEAVRVTIEDSSVRSKLTGLLHLAGIHAEHARAAMDRLWILARDDTRETHPHPDHALRVLSELGGYDHGRLHHQALLDLVEAELAGPQLGDHPNSPLLLLAGLLSREGTRSRVVGIEWRMSSYFVDPETSRPWRDRVRSILVEQALRGAPRERTAAAKLFEEALRLPHGYFGRPVPVELRDAWKPDEEATLDAIEQVARATDDSSVRVELIHALDWHAAHGAWEDFSARAAALIALLSEDGDADAETLAAIATPWDLLEEKDKTERDERVATRLLERFDSGGALAHYLEGLLAEIATRKIADYPEPHQVLFRIFEASPRHAAEVWDWVLTHPDARLVTAGPLALSGLKRAGENVDDRLEAAGAAPVVVLRRIVAGYLAGGAWFKDASATELRLLDSMGGDEDALVRDSIATALLRLGADQPGLAVGQALKVRIDPHDGRSADLLFSTIHDYGVNKLTPEQLEQLTHQLLIVSEPGYFAHQVLTDLGQLEPRRVVALWAARIRRHQVDDPPRYRPVPFHDHGVEMLGGASADERTALNSTMLRELRALDSWRRRELGQIYWRLALPGVEDDKPADDLIKARQAELDSALTAVEDFLGEKDSHVEVFPGVLSELPWQVLLARPDWVGRILGHDDAEQQLADALHAAGISGAHGRSVGEDSPRWTATLAGATAALEHLQPGTAAAELYSGLERIAQKEIDKDRRQDDEERAGWQ